MRELIALAAVCLLVVSALQAFVVRGFWVPSASMEPTLNIDDRIVVDQLTPHFTDYQRGDIVVFRDPGGWLGAAGREDFLVKRIIAVAGDTITGSADGTVAINGAILVEPWAHHSTQDPFNVTVPAGEVWVMGDNRGNSADSRVHGTVPSPDIVGRVVWVYWPLTHWGAPAGP
ncbi:signal peptidase I [Microbacterium gorillae]|uniref:signal peptidase I n=1 Tax=Microbacterium gorillae TaxID=1231063 RepID=UPI003D988909